MKVTVMCLFAVMFHSLFCGCGITGSKTAGLPGGILPAPVDAEHKAYLGLPSETETFALRDIKADLVVIMVMDTYCRRCQKAAPGVCSLYELVRGSPYRDRIRIIGAAIGNTDLEAGLFRKKFNTPFPLLPDTGKGFGKQFDYTTTPEFIVMKRKPDGSFRELCRRTGYFTDPESVFDWILRRAKWNEEKES